MIAEIAVLLQRIRRTHHEEAQRIARHEAFEQRLVTLADGSRLRLNTDSAVRVRLGSELRRVELLRLRFQEGLPVRDIARRWAEDAAKRCSG